MSYVHPWCSAIEKETSDQFYIETIRAHRRVIDMECRQRNREQREVMDAMLKRPGSNTPRDIANHRDNDDSDRDNDDEYVECTQWVPSDTYPDDWLM